MTDKEFIEFCDDMIARNEDKPWQADLVEQVKAKRQEVLNRRLSLSKRWWARWLIG